MSIVDEKSQELPNQWACSLDFEKKITCMALSVSGNIMAVGLMSNPIIVCDSETSSNRHFYEEHKSSPKTLSFSNHGHFLASGDKAGFVIVRHLLSRDKIYQKEFKGPIIEVLFSPTETETLLVLDSSRHITLVNVLTTEEKSMEGDFVSVCFHPYYNKIFAATNKDIYMFDTHFSELSHYPSEDKKNTLKNILKIEISHQGLLLLIIEKNGGCLLFNPEAQAVIHTFQDSVGGMKWTSAVFDPKDELVVFATNEMALRTLTIFSIADQLGTIISDLQGPNEPVGQLLYHPHHPVIYTRGIESIRVWTPTFLNSWSNFMPGFVDAIANDLYYEREDEFDEEETVAEPEKIIHEDLIDVFSPVTNKNIMNSNEVLNYMPLDIDSLVKFNQQQQQ
ncbi:hypothetical protein TRFO_24061 [Tritrichomonas foetus]|uniref:Anaphase-promoting complex subunit 4 WD40 domain-containing protein n=1 Tax=Tritrichomonas foetus TaxID=1144522 RepID=A0A1J4KDW5_9EUKA|nr:hypothetical protein TRFO_24061 [Tritrichomonas foetus]|eukprot:OHT07653.1 hypothetical protein TRFO_24061 [Tritrichomonas foetus]